MPWEVSCWVASGSAKRWAALFCPQVFQCPGLRGSESPNIQGLETFVSLHLCLFFVWLCWVLVAVCKLSLVAASGGYSSLQCTGFSLRWLLLLQSAGFSSCGSRALERRLSSCGARA